MSLVAMAMTAQTTAYAVYCAGSDAENDPATLYFLAAETEPTGTYNGQTITEVWSGEAVTKSGYYAPDWSSYNRNITRVVFEESFKAVKPTTCLRWFYGCAKLATIEGIANLNTASVTTMSYMFYDCSALTTLNLSSFTTGSVNDMNHMFYGCSALESLDLSSFTTGSVNDMNHMFYGCSALESLDLSSFTTGSVNNMSYMFRDCKALTTLDLSSFTTGEVMSMAEMFYNCKALKTLDLSSFNTEAVTDMNCMFSGCSALESLTLGSSFTAGNVEFMSSMFEGCKALTTLNLNSFKTEKVTRMSSMFAGCSALTTLDLSNFTTEAVTDMSSMFNYCSALESLTLGSSFTAEKVTNMGSMFSRCRALTTLNLSSFKTGEVITMNSMFGDCSALESLTLGSNFTTGKVTDMTSMFAGCSALKTLDLSSFSTSKLEYYNNMFAGCDALLSLDLRNAGLGGLMAATNSGFAKRGMVFYLSDVASTSGDAFEENYVVKRDVDFTSFARTFTGGKISTVCLPFAVYAGNDFGTFYEFKDCNDGKTVKFTKLTNGNTVANKAYLFKPNETAGDVKVIFETFSTAIDGLPELTEGDANGLYGVYTKKEFTPEEADRNIYYGWSAGNFVSIGAGATLSHGRAYLKVTAPQGGNAKDILKAIFDDETTGISEVNTTAADYNAPAYDLMGRRVGAGYKGIVIKNGKKVMPL